MKGFLNFLKKRLTINISLIVIVFSISVLIRMDNLKAPMGRNHEWLTGHVLSTLSIFEKNGITNHYFAPVFLFDEKAEHYLISFQKFKDKNNYAYYTSYPPFCFVFPYLLFKLSFSAVSVTGIRVISLLIHLVCALLILLITNRFFKKSLRDDIFIPGYIGFSLYLFSSGNLWFHANVYFADMLVHVFVLGALYVYLSVLEKPEEKTRTRLIGLFIFTFLGVYTEWLALFVAFYMCVFLLIKTFRNKKYFRYVLSIAFATFSALGLALYQYCQIAGFDALQEYMVNKYKQRSGFVKDAAESGFSVDNPLSKNRVFEHYENNYSSLLDYAWLVLYIVLALVILNFIKKKTKLTANHILVFLVILLSIATHHTAFFNFTVVHDFSTLKSSIFFTLFISFMIGLFCAYFDNLNVRRVVLISAILTTGWFIHFSVKKYYYISRHSPADYFHKIAGEALSKYAKTDEIAFLNENITPVTWWYAKRNIYLGQTPEQAIEFLKFAKYEKGLLVKMIPTDKSYLVEVYRLKITGEILKVQ